MSQDKMMQPLDTSTPIVHNSRMHVDFSNPEDADQAAVYVQRKLIKALPGTASRLPHDVLVQLGFVPSHADILSSLFDGTWAAQELFNE